ncbi:MAG: DnaJ domain-containing protein [Hyphomicrobiales bacterium]|nr:DnaJ domain-containing protein [Hyphomicrobiales bacterium]
MDLNSRLFDRIRVKPRTRAPERSAPAMPCSHPGCTADGLFRAPKGREREGEYFSFCKDHVREYNASYDYFRGMDDESMAKFRQADAIGHRPTWKLGARAASASHVDESVFAEARAARRRGVRGAGRPEDPPRYNVLALKALMTLELGGDATPARIKARYKDLVKRHHPDANGGDRSSEDKLREIIQAYNYLRANKLV